MRSVQAAARSFNPIDDDGPLRWDPNFIRTVLQSLHCLPTRTILDVGSGLGHWARILGLACPDAKAAVLLDINPYCVSELRALAAQGGLFPVTDVVLGDVRDIPGEGGRFDLVSCQTVLMHMSDPVAAVREMMRVCRHGGAILIAEPVTILDRAQFHHATEVLAPEETAALVHAWSAYHRGVKLVYGYDYDIALRMPGVLRAAGVDPVKVVTWKNPRLSPPGHGARLSAQFTGDKLTLAQAAGLMLEDWEKARRAAIKLETCARRPLCHDEGLYLFGFTNP